MWISKHKFRKPFYVPKLRFLCGRASTLSSRLRNGLRKGICSASISSSHNKNPRHGSCYTRSADEIRPQARCVVAYLGTTVYAERRYSFMPAEPAWISSVVERGRQAYGAAWGK
jgi:hypothetical protein